MTTAVANVLETDSQTESDLIRRCQTGEKDAFGPIVKRYAGQATGAAYMLLGCSDEAMDASQEAFVRAWRHIGRFDPAAPFYPWYRTILRNICLGRLRQRARRKTVALTDGHADGSADADPTLLARRTERSDLLWRAIMRLPLAHREIILMNHFQGMAYKEMAAALDIPIGTVMSRLHHARQALREKLDGEDA
jgi:RNA polymerase sigma-70 factor (ECF subfamily)